LAIIPTFSFAANDDEIRKLEEKAAFVRKATLPELLQKVDAQNWVFPVIYSQWHVHEVANEEERPLLNAQRSLGEALAIRLDEWAGAMLAADTFQENKEWSSRLIALARWLSHSSGYGNFMLAARCHDIATVGLARMVADLNHPLEGIAPLLQELDASWKRPQIRAAVLNAEVGTNLFSVAKAQAEDGHAYLERTWNDGRLLRLKHSNPEMQKAFDGSPPKGYETIASLVRDRSLRKEDAPIFLKKQAFFEDSHLAGASRPITTLSTWNAKWHEKFIVGFALQNLVEIKALLTFRKRVGSFPSKPQFTDEELRKQNDEIAAAQEMGIVIVSFEDTFNSPMQAAFAQAWEKHATEKTMSLHYTASRAYARIQKSLFFDADTEQQELQSGPTDSK